MKKPHGNTGNKNAMKGGSPAERKVSVPMEPYYYNLLRDQATKAKMSMAEWVRRVVVQELFDIEMTFDRLDVPGHEQPE